MVARGGIRRTRFVQPIDGRTDFKHAQLHVSSLSANTSTGCMCRSLQLLCCRDPGLWEIRLLDSIPYLGVACPWLMWKPNSWSLCNCILISADETRAAAAQVCLCQQVHPNHCWRYSLFRPYLYLFAGQSARVTSHLSPELNASN